MKIFCVGRNYLDHAKELGNAVPDEPVIFMKPKSALILPSAPFYYPQFSNELHYEVEVVLRICKNGRYVEEQNASKYYNAYTLGIDFTARDIQNELKKKGLPWEKAKAWDNSALLSATWFNIKPNEITDDIEFSLKQNSNIVQKRNTKDMIFSFNTIISHISQYFSLNIGDIVYTGTPAGVGECMPGDILEGFISDKSVFLIDIK